MIRLRASRLRTISPDETTPASTSTQAGAEPTDRLRAVVPLIGSVVAPTTLLTALLFYFGWAHAYWFFHYFGFDISLLGLTTQDYMMRSVDALFVPLTLFLTIGSLLLWAHSAVAGRLFAGPSIQRRLRVSAIVMAVIGLVLFLVGMAGIFVRALRETYYVAFPLSLGTGAILLLYASRLQRRAESSAAARTGFGSIPLLEATGAFLLVALSLFWAATNYAAAVGGTRARQYERELKGYSEAILYSKENLHLDGPGVEAVVCQDPGAGYRFRYQGLRLMLRSSGQYFLLPEDWSPSNGAAIVVPEGDSVRLQFAAPGRVRQRPANEAGAAGC